jgi:tartrate dehydratase beta subunit/fumarate hydratase class I family protein
MTLRPGKPGEQLLLSGKLLTGRDAAHKKLADTDRDRPAPAGRFPQ